MPRPRRPHKASPDEIKITRDGDYAIIVYADEGVATTHFKMGREKLAVMTDEQILKFWNDGIEARDAFMAAQHLVAVEIPMGKPQLKYEERSDQWVPRGHIVKGVCPGRQWRQDRRRVRHRRRQGPHDPRVRADDVDLRRLGIPTRVCSRHRHPRRARGRSAGTGGVSGVRGSGPLEDLGGA